MQTVKELIDKNEITDSTMRTIESLDRDYHENTYVWQNFWIQDEDNNILYRGVYTNIPKNILEMEAVSGISNIKSMLSVKVDNKDCILGMAFNKITVKANVA